MAYAISINEKSVSKHENFILQLIVLWKAMNARTDRQVRNKTGDMSI